MATDLQDLADLLRAVGLGGDDEGTIKQIDGETVRGLIGGSTDLSDTSVGGHDDDGSLVAFQSSIEEGEALDVEHVNLIDEEDTRHDLSTAFLSPLGDLLVDLFSYFRLDLTDITSEEGHEALGAGVDDIDLVKSDSVDDLLALLEITLGALDEASLRANVVEVTAAGE